MTSTTTLSRNKATALVGPRPTQRLWIRTTAFVIASLRRPSVWWSSCVAPTVAFSRPTRAPYDPRLDHRPRRPNSEWCSASSHSEGSRPDPRARAAHPHSARRRQRRCRPSAPSKPANRGTTRAMTDMRDSKVHGLPDSVFVATAPSGEIVFSNMHADRVVGRDLSELASEFPIFHPDGRPYSYEERQVPRVNRVAGGDRRRGVLPRRP
jgi:hypothetical protein